MSEETLDDLIDRLVDFCNALESSVVRLRKQIKTLTKTSSKAQLPVKHVDYPDSLDDIQAWINPKGGFKAAPSKEMIKLQLREEIFTILKWKEEKRARLGDFQVAYKNNNLPDKWNHCFNVLKANNSLIANPLKPKGYEFRYWLYPAKYKNRIFRKKMAE